nr:RNA-directed DNA polymerase, eukaryota, reverse transcriptase zinc-binding domain protein [Tanacetum cinerariifolium]
MMEVLRSIYLVVGDGNEQEDDLVSGFEEEKQADNNVEDRDVDDQENKSEDPFQIYKLLHKNNKVDRNEGVSDDGLKYPPRFTPHVSNDADSSNVVGDNNATVKEEGVNNIYEANEGSGGIRVNGISKANSTESGMSGHFKTSLLPRTGGSILGILDEVVKVGQVMRYNIEGCLAQKAKKDWVKELCVKFKVNFLALQETKMESMDLLCVRMRWGNLTFEYAQSDSVGNAGGILCMWDSNSFVKHNVTRSDYFVMLRGVWRMTGQLVLLIVVYAPQEVSEKRLLWDYLQSEICKWNGEVVIMGDFNKVRYKSDRYGSKFNAHSAMVFNSFILNSGLVEVSLGRCSFTWCHKTAAKMSKLGRFLVSESFLNSCPNINAITLERYLSDHRPILFRDAHVDYGPTPFRFFHCWLEMEGFAKMVEDEWRDSPCDRSNALRNLTGKLKHLKNDIRVWNKSKGNSNRDAKAQLKLELEVVDLCIDNGNRIVEDIKRRGISVRWDFLDEVLKKFGFGEKWCKWIQACLKSSRGSVIINGSPTEEFQFGKWPKQGDPLSSFLFLLIMESLHLSFQRVVDTGLFHSLQLGGSVNLSHMFFADDAVFVRQRSEGNINSLVNILEYFNMASGLKFNMRKSKIMGVHVTRDKVDKAATKLGCLVLKAPFLYLGSMVGGAMYRSKSWYEVVDRVKNAYLNRS